MPPSLRPLPNSDDVSGMTNSAPTTGTWRNGRDFVKQKAKELPDVGGKEVNRAICWLPEVEAREVVQDCNPSFRTMADCTCDLAVFAGPTVQYLKETENVILWRSKILTLDSFLTSTVMACSGWSKGRTVLTGCVDETVDDERVDNMVR